MSKNSLITDELELDLDVELENENDFEEDSDSETSTKKIRKEKREPLDNSEQITIINNFIRFVTKSDGCRSLQKLVKYTDGTEEWIHNGWFGYKDDGSMFRVVIQLIRDMKLKEKEVSDLKYYIKCFKDAKKEVQEYFNVEFNKVN
jgi:hypothetical protein